MHFLVIVGSFLRHHFLQSINCHRICIFWLNKQTLCIPLRPCIHWISSHECKGSLNKKEMQETVCKSEKTMWLHKARKRRLYMFQRESLSGCLEWKTHFIVGTSAGNLRYSRLKCRDSSYMHTKHLSAKIQPLTWPSALFAFPEFPHIIAHASCILFPQMTIK